MERFSSAQINSMLDYADCPAHKASTKRRDAYVIEWYFEQSILPEVSLSPASTGWCYFEQYGNRIWFKVVDNYNVKESERQVDRRIVSLLKNISSSQRFFTIFEDRQSIAIREIVHKVNGWWQVPVSNPQSICDIASINDRAVEHCNVRPHPAPFAEKWLSKAGDEYRRTLLIQRLLMNYGLGERYPLDVDGIEVRDSRLVFHEFKRKTQMPDGCFVVCKRRVDNFFINNLCRKIRESGRDYGKPLFDFVENELEYPRDANAHCYGLDQSHLSNFEFCQRNGISYVYSIWDSRHYADKPEIDKLFDQNIEPTNGVRLLSATLNEKCAMGFIFTRGSDSGSFHGRMRVQAALNAELFVLIKSH